MVRRKPIRTRGKIKLSEYFKKLKENDRVAVKKERAKEANFPDTLQGRTGYVKGKKGSHYIVSINDGKKSKDYTIHPIHLKKLKNNE